MHALGETRLDWLVWRLARSLVNKSEIQNEYDGILITWAKCLGFEKFSLDTGGH